MCFTEKNNYFSTLTNFGAATIWLRLLRLTSCPLCAKATSLKEMKKPCKQEMGK